MNIKFFKKKQKKEEYHLNLSNGGRIGHSIELTYHEDYKDLCRFVALLKSINDEDGCPVEGRIVYLKGVWYPKFYLIHLQDSVHSIERILGYNIVWTDAPEKLNYKLQWVKDGFLS